MKETFNGNWELPCLCTSLGQDPKEHTLSITIRTRLRFKECADMNGWYRNSFCLSNTLTITDTVRSGRTVKVLKPTDEYRQH